MHIAGSAIKPSSRGKETMLLPCIDRLPRTLAVLLGCVVAMNHHPGKAWQDERRTAVREFLAQDVLPYDLPLQEVQGFVEVRVPAMVEITTLEAWQAQAERLRRDVLDKVIFRGQAAAWRDATARVEWLETIAGGEGYKIKKLRYEALPGLWIPALLYEPDALAPKTPVVMNVNGHDGNGKAAPYKQIRCINQAKRGMLVLNVEWLGMGQLRGEGFGHYRMNQLDLCGTSGLAPFYLAMKRGLDVLLAHPHADPERVAVAGLSGGGWQTIVISSLDTRVTLANPVAGFSSYRTRARHFEDLGDSEQTPSDLATVADYTHLTALRAPRPTLLTYNSKDNCCFASGHALPPLLEAATPVFRLYDQESRLRSHVNHDPGTHNFERENREALYRMLGDFFHRDDPHYTATEIECAKEVKSAEELTVDLPADNANFHTLAVQLMKELPRRSLPPKKRSEAEAWRRNQVEELRKITRFQTYPVAAQTVGEATSAGVQAVSWRLRVGDAWTVPAIELTAGESEATAIVVADGGRGAAVEVITELLARKRRVLAIDPFYIGESRIAQRDFLFALLVAAVGERPLGIQASQISAVAHWAQAKRGSDKVELVAVGPRTSIAALLAAACESEAIERVRLDQSYGSLKEVIEQNGSVDATPELFCFGLLEQFDLRDLVMLAAPRQVVVHRPSPRAQQEFAGLDAWYRLVAKPFDPLQPAE